MTDLCFAFGKRRCPHRNIFNTLSLYAEKLNFMKIKLCIFCIFILTLFSFTSHAQSYIINTFAGNGYGATGNTGSGGYTGDGGQATGAELNNPAGVSLDDSGNVYIADTWNNVIRKVNTRGIISTIAGNGYGKGTGNGGFSGDGGAATLAELNGSTEVAVDDSGNVYIADAGNFRVRKVNTKGIISTIAGKDTAGYSGDGGPATLAKLYYPSGVAVDTSGNIYIADYYNNVIRKVNTKGIISTIAGNSYGAGTGKGGYSGDGGAATLAKLYWPTDVKLDGSGNIYIADMWNNVIRKINLNGIISTIAGNCFSYCYGGYTGDDGPATLAHLNFPHGVSVDDSGNVYIADEDNNAIRKINVSDTISTISGGGIQGYSGDGGLADTAELNDPSGVAVNSFGNVYIADYGNNRIRILSITNTGINYIRQDNSSIKAYPNPNNGNFTIQLQHIKQTIQIEFYNVMGEKIYQSVLTNLQNIINLSSQPQGMYFVYVKSDESVEVGKVLLTK